jgi:hypothetical protein
VSKPFIRKPLDKVLVRKYYHSIMRTKTPKAERQEKSSVASLPIEFVGPSNDSSAEDISRVSFPMDAQGNILWDRMREKTKDQLKSILGNPDTAKVLGVESPAPPSVEVFDPAWTGTVLEALGKMEAFAASKMYKIDSDISEKVFTYSEREKEKIAPPLAKVINKYASTWMVQFKDEIALAFLFATITAVKLQMATALQNTRAGEIKVAIPAQPIRSTITVPSAADLDAVATEQSIKEQTQVA